MTPEFTIARIADELKVSPSTVRRYAKKFRVGILDMRRWLFTPAEAELLAAAILRIEQPPELTDEDEAILDKVWGAL